MTTATPLAGPEPLARNHDLSSFNSGALLLDEYLRRHAWHNHQNRSARTYVTTRDNRVVGYYTLAASSVWREHAPSRIAKGLGNYPMPIILLARLAVDRREQGKGLGAALLKDALLRAIQAADIVGCRALLVHGLDQRAREFYRKYGFETSPVDELHLYLLMKDIKANLGSG